MQEEQEDAVDDETEGENIADAQQQFESAIAAAVDDTALRPGIEPYLNESETDGWHIKETIHRIWSGERDRAALTVGLDEQDTALIERVLTLLEDK